MPRENLGKRNINQIDNLFKAVRAITLSRWRMGCFRAAKVGDFCWHDFADHFRHLTTEKVSKDTAGFQRWNLLRDSIRFTSFTMVSPSVAADEEKIVLGSQSLPSGRP
ncbi:MAG: hypothetical protein CBB71_19760 [Rhodopirellula sp. TMED11]|nr:MAG: hypothetical protein CBB71_19760 [Rhodopirellula sp. TMED11]